VKKPDLHLVAQAERLAHARGWYDGYRAAYHDVQRGVLRVSPHPHHQGPNCHGCEQCEAEEEARS
jgi:hypothetical protein